MNSSEVLELRYDNYMEAKAEARNFENVNNSMRGIIVDLDRQLTRLHIENTEFVIRHVDYFATNKGIVSPYIAMWTHNLILLLLTISIYKKKAGER